MASAPAPPSSIEATTIRKLKTHIIPFVFVLFVINFVDRINIGFAALTMNGELAITSQQFGLLSGIFFWGYDHRTLAGIVEKIGRAAGMQHQGILVGSEA